MANTFNANIGTVNVSATSGNTLVVDTTTLVVDATNNRVGIGTATPTAALDVNGNIQMAGKILNLTTPTDPADAATKGYVDSVASGLDLKASVRVATTANLVATRTSNTLTADANGSINTAGIDGVTTLALNDRVLVKNQSTGADNGIYYISDLGSAGTPWIMIRATDADSSAEVTAGMFCFVSAGTTNGDNGFVLTTNDPITLNTTSLSFTQFNAPGSISLSAIGSSPNANAATLTGTVLNLEPASASFGGVLTAGTQTYAGNKTSNGSLTIAAASGNVLVVDTDVLVVDATNNRVGINNASPAAALDITGAGLISGDLTVDTTTLKVDSTNNRVGIGTASPSIRFHVVGSSMATGLGLVHSTNPTGDFEDALEGRASMTANDPGVTMMGAVYGMAETSGNTAMTVGTSGVQGESYIGSSGNFGRAVGVGGYCDQSGSGTITTMASFYANTNTRASGTVTNNVGLYLEDQAGVGTNNFQIYSANTNPFVVLTNGRVGVGTASPSEMLQVVGNGIVSGDLTVDTTTLKVDATNNRVGVGTASPAVPLDVVGAIATTTTCTATTGFVIGTQKIYNGSAAPVAGTWAVGDIVYNTAPAAGGNIGWVCTSAGTPGTWKEFGLIST